MDWPGNSGVGARTFRTSDLELELRLRRSQGLWNLWGVRVQGAALVTVDVGSGPKRRMTRPEAAEPKPLNQLRVHKP